MLSCEVHAWYDDSGNEEHSDDTGGKWVVGSSGASFHITHSADLLSDVRLCDGKVRIGDNHLTDIEGYGTLTVVFSGNPTVKLLGVFTCRT